MAKEVRETLVKVDVGSDGNLTLKNLLAQLNNAASKTPEGEDVFVEGNSNSEWDGYVTLEVFYMRDCTQAEVERKAVNKVRAEAAELRRYLELKEKFEPKTGL